MKWPLIAERNFRLSAIARGITWSAVLWLSLSSSLKEARSGLLINKLIDFWESAAKHVAQRTSTEMQRTGEDNIY